MTAAATQAALDHHLGAIIAVDVDEMMKDYTEDSVVVVPDGTFKGLAEIRGFFNEFSKALTPEFLAAFEMIKSEVHGDTAYIAWSVGDAVPLGTDTFVVTDGKIRIQTAAFYMAG